MSLSLLGCFGFLLVCCQIIQYYLLSLVFYSLSFIFITLANMINYKRCATSALICVWLNSMANIMDFICMLRRLTAYQTWNDKIISWMSLLPSTHTHTQHQRITQNFIMDSKRFWMLLMCYHITVSFICMI